MWRKSSYSTDQANCVEVMWQKSSHSTSQANCVEVMWQKSSHSEPENCVEVARSADRVSIRDSKNPDGPVLTVPAVDWRGFIRPRG
ncbi:DUF397 domain-containing protein [Saccharothrix violaceirubra]|uniref:DUF397 domain-containing protein n=1 Tax=Saccharothrix violaceirubra TaxID=413306 RepID=A0A7W7WTD5_9PSEU|nr:DUF397 domain-containing protein [Saccharothrix violaceirubra]MBB4963080.1 hypothetical protein [Saccharothrix violaceirubra]